MMDHAWVDVEARALYHCVPSPAHCTQLLLLLLKRCFPPFPPRTHVVTPQRCGLGPLKCRFPPPLPQDSSRSTHAVRVGPPDAPKCNATHAYVAPPSIEMLNLWFAEKNRGAVRCALVHNRQTLARTAALTLESPSDAYIAVCL